MPATYSFFETATQKGYILQVFGELIPRHWERVVETDAVGTRFRFACAKQGSNDILLDITFEGRGPRESSAMWRDRVREGAHKAWETYKRARLEREAKTALQTGLLATDTATSQTSSPTASLTPSPTDAEPSSSGPETAKEPETSASDPSGPTPNEKKSTRISIRRSKRTLNATG